MFLQRLTQWFTNLFSRIASHLRDAVTADAEREPVMSAHSFPTSDTFTPADYLLPPNWLEDARRMRPQLLAPDAAQRRPLEKPEKPQTPGKPRSTGANGEPAHVGATQPPQTPRSTPPSQPTRTASTSPADAAQHDTLDDLLLRRRLMSLKHLVRLGIYNEGFHSERTPEQYHRSLGIEEYGDDQSAE